MRKLTLDDFEVDNRDETTTELRTKDLTIELTKEDLEYLLENMKENNE